MFRAKTKNYFHHLWIIFLINQLIVFVFFTDFPLMFAWIWIILSVKGILKKTIQTKLISVWMMLVYIREIKEQIFILASTVTETMKLLLYSFIFPLFSGVKNGWETLLIYKRWRFQISCVWLTIWRYSVYSDKYIFLFKKWLKLLTYYFGFILKSFMPKSLETLVKSMKC